MVVLVFPYPKKEVHLSDQEPPNETEYQLDQLDEEDEHERSEPETHDGEEVKSKEEQVGAVTTASVATPTGASTTPTSTQPVPWKENPNDFDESTVEIGITLHPLKGCSAGERLVTFCIHNHSGPPVTNFYTQHELTNESPLDRLLWAIAQEIRKFRAELSRRKQEQFEREELAKRTRRETRAASPARSGTPAVPLIAVAAQMSPEEQTALPAVQDELPVSATATKLTTAIPPHPVKQGNELVQHPLF